MPSGVYPRKPRQPKGAGLDEVRPESVGDQEMESGQPPADDLEGGEGLFDASQFSEFDEDHDDTEEVLTPHETRGAGRRRPEYKGVVRAIDADVEPAVGLWFRAWCVAHRPYLVGKTEAQAFRDYLTQVCFEHAEADLRRAPQERQYDLVGLQMESLRDLIKMQVARLVKEELDRARH